MLQNQAPQFHALDPYPWFAWMRQHEHVYQEEATGIWYVFGYEDVLRVLNPPHKPTEENPIVFSSQVAPSGENHHTITRGSILLTDPPRQRVVRELINQAFSPKTLGTYTDRILAIIDGLIDHVINDGEMDVVSALAYEIPVLVISELLGVPQEDREKFKHWAAQAISSASVQDSAVVAVVEEIAEYFLRAIEQRRRQAPVGHPDVISTLVHGCPHDGSSLGEEEMLGNCELLLVAGFETTAHLLTNLFHVLVSFPEVQQQVWENPTLVPALIEETLRYRSPVHVQVRLTRQPTELGGKIIPADQVVMPLLGSANRDGQVWENPEAFDLLRFVGTPPNHVAFGFRGTHYCLGAPLARLEATLMLQRLIVRIKEVSLIPGISLEALPPSMGMVPMVNGLQALPVKFKRKEAR
jgi:cytochrome P450